MVLDLIGTWLGLGLGGFGTKGLGTGLDKKKCILQGWMGLFLAPTRSSRKANVRPFVCSFVRSVQVCLELSIFIILAQTFKLTSKVSLSSLLALS